MKAKNHLKAFLGVLGLSFSMLVISTASEKGKIWYDSEGRPLNIQGNKVTRLDALVQKSVVENPVEKKAQPIIPKTLELRPELSTVKRHKIYRYPRHQYSYGGYNGYYHRGHSYYRGCYRPQGSNRGSIYLNYRRGGLSVHTRF